MIITVESGGYRLAADAFAGGNEMAALQHDALAGRLAAYAAMAGSDSTSTEFASSYDAAAADAVAGLGDVVAAFATLGRLTSASVANHDRAEASSVIGNVTVADQACSAFASVAAARPPSSVGGRPPAFTTTQLWILSHVQGFAWPDADVDRLRDAAQTWRTAADSLHALADSCTSATSALEGQRSPEIPVALAATASLRTTIGDLAVAYADLGAHCDTYADAVAAKHAEILALLREIEMIVAEQLVLGAALGAVSFGLGAAAGAGVAVARIALEAPKFARIIAALRTLADAVAVSVRGTRDALQLRRLELARFLRVPVRDERGAIRLGWHRWEPGWLAKHEHSGSHTLSKHVGKSDDYLRERLSREPHRSVVSTFRDQNAAEWAIEKVLRRRAEEIQAWLGSESHAKRQVTMDVGRVVGRVLDRQGTVSAARVTRVVLVKDSSMPDGFRILTSLLTG